MSPEATSPTLSFTRGGEATLVAHLEARWLIFVGAQSSIPVPFLVLLVFWIAMLFASFGLFAPRNGTVIGVLLVCALSVAGAVFLILEMDQPFEGLVKLSSAPLRYTLTHLGQ